MFKRNIETSIIIRTFNEEKHLGNLLRAIRLQDYKNYEIIIVDSGSIDKTLEIARGFADKLISIEKRDFTFGYSLNAGCKKARGRYLVFISAHVLPADNQWLGNLLSPFADKKTAMVYGVQRGAENGKFSEKMDFQRLSYPNNANSAIRKDLWLKRHFDEYLFGLEDIDWARHASESGFEVKHSSKAVICHLHDEKWPQIFNRYRREAIAAAKIGLSSPPQVKPNYFWLASNIFQDVVASLPRVSMGRLSEIGRFRYYQWGGTRQGWFCDRDINLDNSRYALFYPSGNKAAVIVNKNKAKIENVSLPEMKPRDILIQVNYVGVCRTDLEVYDGSLGYYKHGIAKYPIIPGHEFSGTIVKVGANNKYQERFRVGEKVVGECILSRGNDRQEVGVINYNGAYSQFIVMPGSHIHKVPKSLGLETACLAEPLAVVLRALKRVGHRLESPSKIAVIGAGPIGNLCSQVLTRAGHEVFVFDKNSERLALLKNKAKIGGSEDFSNFDVVIEATGNAQVLGRALRQSKADAVILLLGFPYGPMDYNFEDIVGKEKSVTGSVGGGYEEFEEALALLPKLDTAAFTKNILPLEEFAEAWKLQKIGKHLKIILKP